MYLWITEVESIKQ